MKGNVSSAWHVVEAGGRFFGHAAAIVVGLVLMVVGLALGVTMVLLPVGIVVGLAGVLVFLAGLFAGMESPS